MKNPAQDLPLCLSVLSKKFRESVCAVMHSEGDCGTRNEEEGEMYA
jgi:hypothetical protein